MKKCIFLLILFIGTISGVTYFLSLQNKVWTKSSYGERTLSEKVIETNFIWKDNKGEEYPVYMSNQGSSFIIKTSKRGEN